MNTLRRTCLASVLAAAALLAGCAALAPPPPASPQARGALAPTGKLRVGVYPGSAISMGRSPHATDKNGVAYALGRELARWLNVPFEPVEFRNADELLDAMKAGEVDFTFAVATEARARDVNFTLPMVSLELGYLVPSGSAVRNAAEIDRAGMRIGVIEGARSRVYRHASVVPVATLKTAANMLSRNQLQAFAGSKAILYELADDLPRSRVLDGRWGVEQLAIAIPKGREAGMPYVSQFAQTVRNNGTLQSAIDRADLRGTVKPTYQ